MSFGCKILGAIIGIMIIYSIIIVAFPTAPEFHLLQSMV